MLITPVRPTVPKVGRKAVTPQRAAGYVIEPAVSDPMANGTMPAIKVKQPLRLSRQAIDETRCDPLPRI